MALLLEEVSSADQRLEPLARNVLNSVELHRLVLSAFTFSLTFSLIIIEEILNSRAETADDRRDCPFCSIPLESKGMVSRVMRTLIGTLRWKRRVRRCVNGCPVGLVAPFDEELGIKPNQRTGTEIKHLACMLAVFVPYKIAESLFGNFFCVGVSDGAIWNWVREAGEKAARKLETELEQLGNGEKPEEDGAIAQIENLPLIVGADGVMAPFRPKGGSPEGKTAWHEVKVGIVARMGRRINKEGKEVSVMVRRRVVAVLGKVDEFKSFLWMLSVKEGIGRCKTAVWLSDGGKGFWRIWREQFSGYAFGVLDYYHAVQNVWKGVKGWLDGRTKKAARWFKAARKRILNNGTKGLMEELGGVLATGNLSDENGKALETLLGYLENHIDHMNYADYKNLGLPIGSGIVESTCKWLIQQRFKGVGMRWSENGFISLCSLRVAWVNESFHELFFDNVPPKL